MIFYTSISANYLFVPSIDNKNRRKTVLLSSKHLSIIRSVVIQQQTTPILFDNEETTVRILEINVKKKNVRDSIRRLDLENECCCRRRGSCCYGGS